MNNAKNLFNSLPENEQLLLVEKVMPMSGLYRQIENKENWSDGQWQLLHDEFINSIHWEQGEELESIDVHDKTYIVKGESDLGNRYEATGIYSDDELVSIEYLHSKDFWVECNICKAHLKNWSGSTPCCGSIAYIIEQE